MQSSSSHPLAQYYYELPPELIRKEPLVDRDTSRLLVYDTASDTIVHDHFYNLPAHIPAHSTLVMNDTGVIPARVTWTKDTGGKVRGLLLINEGIYPDGTWAIIVDEELFPGRTIRLGDCVFTIDHQVDQRFFVRTDATPDQIYASLYQYGSTPIPYYLGPSTMTESDVRSRYQTVFAQSNRSVAAPTASLHMTERVLAGLRDQHVAMPHVTLDVGLGTFATVEDKHVASRTLHNELISIPVATSIQLQQAAAANQPIVALGTTVVRTLESHADRIMTATADIHSQTDMFIMRPYEFQMVDQMITNFHVPQSSLMALVDAFLGYKSARKNILDLYTIAIDEKYMFYSFGDAMYIR